MPPGELSISFDFEQRWEGFLRRRGSLTSADGLRVAVECFEPDGEGQRPFVIVLPYLEGSYAIPRSLCKTLARHGIASAFLERPADILAPEQTGETAEKAFEITISRYRAFLGWAAARPSVDRERLGLVGISLGAIMGTTLLAVEPQVGKGMLILPGGDIPQILLRSSEPKVTDYLKERGKREHLRPEDISEDFRAHFLSDPMHLAPFVDPRKVLMVTARFDGVIPRECSDKLWEELGKPERIFVPTGHGTTGFALQYVEARMLRLFQN